MEPSLAIAGEVTQPSFELVSPGVGEQEAIGFLHELISDSLNRHKNLSITVSTNLVDTIENSIRLGWYLDDVKSFLAPEGKFTAWVQANFKSSFAWLYQMRKLSSRFARDLVDSQQRERLGIKVRGLDSAIGPHLRTQIKDAAPTSLSALLRTTGVLPALPAPDMGNEKMAASSKTAIDRAIQAAQRLQMQLNRTDPVRLSQAQRDKLSATLRPIIAYGHGLSL